VGKKAVQNIHRAKKLLWEKDRDLGNERGARKYTGLLKSSYKIEGFGDILLKPEDPKVEGDCSLRPAQGGGLVPTLIGEPPSVARRGRTD